VYGVFFSEEALSVLCSRVLELPRHESAENAGGGSLPLETLNLGTQRDSDAALVRR